MRKKIVAGNWKMNKTYFEGIELVKEVVNILKENPPKLNEDRLHIVFGTPYIHLFACKQLIRDNTQMSISAQNCYLENSGAYTGEISAEMIKSTGASFVIIGHSERRSIFKEDDQTIAKKVTKAIDAELLPIFCCGELLPEREANNHFKVVEEQIKNGVFHLSESNFERVVIAYEPVWAIGTGVTATPDQAQEMHAFIRNTIKEKFGEQIADNTTILYGGSCKPSNAEELFANSDVDGGLIGGASLKAQDFVDIILALK